MTEYIAIEQKSQTKHEYHDGSIFAMSGGSIEHGLISGNTFGEIKFNLRNQQRACTTINSEVLSKSTESYDRGDKFYFYRQIPSLQVSIF